jgi:cytochrome b
MNASLPNSPTASGATAAHPTTPSRGRRVTDAPTRAMHALLALSFAGAWLTAESEHWRLVHVTLGYTAGGVLLARVLYGLFGPRQARLQNLVGKLKALPGWLAAFRGPLPAGHWRQAQNLAMALVVAVLMLGMVPLVLSGYVTYQDFGGWTGEAMEELHEFFGNGLLLAVFAHLGLIVGLSLLRGQNQAAPMLTGRLPGKGPDLARRNHGWLAALIVTAVLAFWAWQWQTAPSASKALLGDGARATLLERGQGHGDDD